jgi:hypothetical protein
VAERLEQQASGLIVAHDADGQDIDAEVGQIVDGVGAASGHHGAFAIAQDQNRRLPRNSRDLPKDKFVRHQVADYGDGDLGERGHDLL